MKEVKKWEAQDGELFDSADECKAYEDSELAEEALNTIVRSFYFSGMSASDIVDGLKRKCERYHKKFNGYGLIDRRSPMEMKRPCGICEHQRCEQYPNSHVHQYSCAAGEDPRVRLYCSKYKRRRGRR